MCTALAGGMIQAGTVKAQNIIISDTYQPQLDKLEKTLGVETTQDNIAVVERSDIILLAVKPNVVPNVISQIKSVYTADKLIISICAGVSIETIEKNLDHKTPRVARVMPNTPALYGAGASGFCLGAHAAAEDAALVEKLMGAVGLAMQVRT